MKSLTSVCVYCGSSNRVDPVYKEAAHELGKTLAQNDIRLVYGGGQVGLMGCVADGVLNAGGKVTGFIPQYLHEYEVGHSGITQLFIVDTMHERKRLMFEHSDGFVILPGGFGTLDEICEVITWRQLRLHTKPIVIVDIENYWSLLFDTFIAHMIEKNFVHPSHRSFYTLVKEVSEILPALESMPKDTGPDLVSKWT